MIRIAKLSDLTEPELRSLYFRSEQNLEHVMRDLIEPMAQMFRNDPFAALREYSSRYEKAKVSSFVLTREDLNSALDELAQVQPEILESFRLAYQNIRDFHLAQRPADVEAQISGNRLGLKYAPMSSVAAYVPGGKALYPSTVLMSIIPARIAGVEDITLISPPQEDGQVPLVVRAMAALAGADRILVAGGAQAIFAVAHGVPELGIRPVDFICGPGNIYVAAAKAYVSNRQYCGIDSFAGPSEVVIIADDNANPVFLANDMLAQAEHDENAQAILLVNSAELADKVAIEIRQAVNERPERAAITEESIRRNGLILIVDDLSEAIRFSNEYAPEHLEIQVSDPEQVLSQIRSAGSIFLGEWAPVAAGDYYTGTNHILPTGGACRFASGVSVLSFLKRITWQSVTETGLKAGARAIATMSQTEGLFAEHGYSVLVRFPDMSGEEFRK